MTMKDRIRRRALRVAPLAASLLLALAGRQGIATGKTTHNPSDSSHRPTSILPVTSCADDGGGGTLRAVVAGAASGDTIDLSQLTCGTITLLTGQIEVHVDDLTINGPGQDLLSIDGYYNGRVFLHDGAGTLTLSNLTVMHGLADNAAQNPTEILGGYGGCIFSRHDFYSTTYEGSVALINATVTSCQAVRSPNSGFPHAHGGGIYAEGSVSLSNSTVSNSSVTGVGTGGAGGFGAMVSGGGIFARYGSITIADSVVSGNSARTGDPTPIRQARGGGLSTYGGGAIVVTNSLVSNNFAGCDTSTSACVVGFGGGIDADTPHLTVSSSIISNNAVAGSLAAYGGGIFNYVESMPSSTMEISNTTIGGNVAYSPSFYSAKGGGLFTVDSIPANVDSTAILASTISGNSAGTGGGIYADRDALVLLNSTVSGNSAGSAGGGIYLGHNDGYYYTEPLSVSNSTITANTSGGTYGGGGVVDTHHHDGPSTFQSTIIAGNTNTAASPIYDADLGVHLGTIDGANNLIIAANGVTLPQDTIQTDPLLGPLQDNGGPTWTHALDVASPAVDTGNNAAALSFDQRGSGFGRVSGIAADIGAFEFQQPFSAPAVTKDFTPNILAVGEASVLTITLTNINNVAATLTTDLVDSLPAPVVVADLADATTTCPGGTAVADPGTGSVTLGAGAQIPAASSCTVTVSVTADVEGGYTNTIPAGALQTDQGDNADSAIAVLTVTATPPSVAKTFTPDTIGAGGVSTLTITLTNENAVAATLSAVLVDALPTQVVVANPPNASTTCADGAVSADVDATTVTLNAGAGIPTAGSCVVVVSVTANAVGVYTNTIPANALQTNFGSNADPASAVLTITQATPPDRIFADGFDGASP